MPTPTDPDLDRLDAARIDADPDNARGHVDPTTPENRDLAASIRLHGVLVPLLVALIDGRHLLVDGHRRFAVGVAAGVNRFPVRVVTGLTPADRAVLQVVANLQRADVCDLALAAKLARLLEVQKWTQKHLAGLLGKSEATVTRLIALDRAPDPVKELVRAGRLAASAAATLAALPDDDQVALATRLAEGELDRTGLAKAVRSRRPGRAGRKAAACSRPFRLSLGRGEEMVFKAAGELTPQGLIERLKRVIAAAERAQRQNLGVRVIADLLKGSTEAKDATFG